MSVPQQEVDFTTIEGVELSIEKTRARAERAATALRESGAEPHLIEALEQAQEELSDLARRLRQSTYL
jgi:hypothetical protein